MGRRKKEPEGVHRERIASAASTLFMEKSINETSMDDIAKAAGYSKATLYVYFQNKEEIISVLVLKSMEKLYRYISSALEQQKSTRARYELICRGLVQYQEEFPFYFRLALDKINIDFTDKDSLSEDVKTFQVGEAINKALLDFLISGIEKGDLRSDLNPLLTILNFWGLLSGLVQLAAAKEAYIESRLDLSKDAFLEYGFLMLYRSIANTNV